MQTWAEVPGSKAEHLPGHGHTEIQWLAAEGGQVEHSRGRRRGNGWLSSSCSRMEGHGCPWASCSASTAGTGGFSARARCLVNAHSLANPTAPKPVRKPLWFCAFNLLRSWQESPQALRQRLPAKSKQIFYAPNTQCLRGRGQEWVSRARHAGE